MKKLITICLLMVITFASNAQTKEETLKWFKKQKAHMEDISSNQGVREGKIEFTDTYIRVFSNKNGEKEQTTIYWSQIESIHQALHNSGRYYIAISMEEKKYTNIFFFYSGNGSAFVDKLVHMADLNGTDVVVDRFDMRG